MGKLINTLLVTACCITFSSACVSAQGQEMVLENLTAEPLELYEFSISTGVFQGVPFKTHVMAGLEGYMNYLNNAQPNGNTEGEEKTTEALQLKSELKVISSDDIWSMIERGRTEDILKKRAKEILLENLLMGDFNFDNILGFLNEGVAFKPIRVFSVAPGEQVEETVTGNEMTVLWENPENDSSMLTTFRINENDSKITFSYSDQTETALLLRK